MRERRTMNERLPEPPSDEQLLRTLFELDHEHEFGASAQSIAWKLDVQGARRLGRGAVAHSWTGTMAPALRVAPRLRSLVGRGLADSYYDTERHRRFYYLTKAGREMLDA